MGKLFDRSLEQVRYYEAKENFEKNFSSFSLKNEVFTPPPHYKSKIPLISLGGVPLSGDGKNSENVFTDCFDSHTLIIGPTGSKKSRLVIMPTVRLLGSAKESIIICDPKREIYDRTAEFLKSKGYNIMVLNLRTPDEGDSWNPLTIAYNHYIHNEIDLAYEFANDVATNLALQDIGGDKDPFWRNSFASLFLGLTILLFKYCYENKLPINDVNIGNLIELRKVLFQDSREPNKNVCDYAAQDASIETLLSGTLSAPENTRRCILATFDEKVRMFTIRPSLMRMLSSNSINFDIINEVPTAIFLVLPDEKTSYHGLVSIFVKQSYEYIISKLQQKNALPNKNNAYIRVNYVLDEFSSLPTIKDFPAMITAARSRNIRFNIVIQSKHQLVLRYSEEADTIQSNCNNWLFLTSRELKLLDELVRLGGVKTDELGKEILPISELQRLDKDAGEILILSGRYKPYVTRLPDIEEYDKNQFNSLKIQIRKQDLIDRKPIDFKTFFNVQKKSADAALDW